MKLANGSRVFMFILAGLQLISFYQANAQSGEKLTLEEVQQKARINHPLIKQKDLLRQVEGLSIKNLSKGYLPQLSLNGQATYQSEVLAINIPLPDVKLQPLSKDQYRATADLSQVLYNGGTIKLQQDWQKQNRYVEEQKIEVELYKVKARVTEIYLGMLYLEEQVKSAELVKKDLQTGIGVVEAQIANGVANPSSLNSLKAEVLKADQKLLELKAGRKGMLDVLSLFLDRQLPEDIQLQVPDRTAADNAPATRPELKLFREQKKLLYQQSKAIGIRSHFKTSAFVQAGYGRPGLNFLKNEFDPFYIAGLRLNFSIGGLYTSKNEKKIIDINQRIIDVQQDLFLLNNNSQLKEKAAEMEKLAGMIALDHQIIELRKSIKETARVQLENNVMTVAGYLHSVNEEDVARQNLSIHQLQLVQSKINYALIKGE